MTMSEPDGPYVYQPYGAVERPVRGEALYGVGGVGDAQIRGVTKEQAERIVIALNVNTDPSDKQMIGAMMGLVEKGVPTDLMGVLLQGNPVMGVRAGALKSAVAGALASPNGMEKDNAEKIA